MQAIEDLFILNNLSVETLQEKRDSIFRNPLCVSPVIEVIPQFAPTVPKVSLLFPYTAEFGIIEVIFGIGSKAPGNDGLTSAIKRLAWPQTSTYH